jgi:pyruvate kinase
MTEIRVAAFDDPSALLEALLALRSEVLREGQMTFDSWKPYIQRRAFCLGARNLAYYLALRRRELRPLQTALMPWGLSSLGRAEARALANLDAVIATLGEIAHYNPALLPPRPRLRTFFRGQRLLERETRAVFGPQPAQRRVRIMVTFPTAAAEDYAFVRDLLLHGMDVARINCAHDTPDAWAAMIAHVRRAEQETGCTCRIHMDLGGPKNRTGSVLNMHSKRVQRGDSVLLRRDAPVESTSYPVQVGCTLPEVLDSLLPDAQVWIDDGKIGGRVVAQIPEGAVIEITHARAKGEKLRVDKGINLPDTPLLISALTDKDRTDLDFVAHHADIIGYSFVQRPEDITLLQNELAARLADPTRIAIIAKIETKLAVQNLPELIVTAAGRQPFGVMIARGDLAVEIGYERLAEIQEEILWLCEAAHVPVVWATQVLERLAKKGTPSRAEMTDAAMAERAECVMLNKGPFIDEALRTLDNVLTRMRGHQFKKTQQLRALHSWKLLT